MKSPREDARRNGFDIRKKSPIIIFVLIAAFALNVLFFIIFTRPAISSYRYLNADSNPTLKMLTAKRDTLKELQERMERIDQTESRIKEMYENIFGMKDQKMVDIQLEIVSIANEFGINPASVSYESNELSEEGVEKFSISIPLTGTYANLRQFVNKIENSKNFLIIDRIFLRTGKEGGVNLQLNIQLSTFFNAPYIAEMKKIFRRRI